MQSTKQKELHEYPQIMTMKELAEFLRMSPRTLYNKRSIGADLPPSIQISKKVLYERDEVQKWLHGMIKGGTRRVA